MVDIHRPELKRQRQRRRWLYGSIAVAVLAVAGFAVFSLDPAAPTVARNSAWTDTVRTGEFVREVRGPGSLVPKEIRWVPAASAGRVERILVKPGARVEADSVLVELSNPELVQQADDAPAEGAEQLDQIRIAGPAGAVTDCGPRAAWASASCRGAGPRERRSCVAPPGATATRRRWRVASR